MPKCKFCNSKENLEEHHIFPRNKADKFGFKEIQLVEHPDNKIIVCNSCHNKLHETYDDYFWRLATLFYQNLDDRNITNLAKLTRKIDQENDL